MKKIISIVLTLLLTETAPMSSVLASTPVNSKEKTNPQIILMKTKTNNSIEVRNITTQPLIINKEGFKYEPLNSKVPLIVKKDVRINAKNITFSDAVIEGNVYISSDNVKLNNLNIKGSLFVDPGKGGTAVLNNVTVNNIIVLSGGERGIYLNKVVSNSLNVNSLYKAKIETMGATEIRTTTIMSNTVLDSYSGSFGHIIIVGKTVQKVAVEFKGTFMESVTVKSSAEIKTDTTSRVEKIVISPESSNSSVSLNGEFENIDVYKSTEVDLVNRTSVTGKVNLLSSVKINTGDGAEIAMVNIPPSDHRKSISLSGAGVFREVNVSGEATLELKDNTFIRDKLLAAAPSTIKASSLRGITKIEIDPSLTAKDLIEIGGHSIQIIDIYSSAKIILEENTTTIMNIKTDNANIKTSKDSVGILDTNGHAATLVEAENYNSITYQDIDIIYSGIVNQILANKILDKKLDEQSNVDKNVLLGEITEDKLLFQKSLINEINSMQNPNRKAYLESIIINSYNNKLVVVNKNRSLPDNWKPNDLVQIKVPYRGRSDALSQLFTKAKKDRISIYAVSGFRSFALQKTVYSKNISQLGQARANVVSAFPGKSEHQTGLAMDISSPALGYTLKQSFGNTREGKWLKENAALFGFIIRYPKGKESITGYTYEPWHIRYVGKENAVEIMLRGITLEEYLGIK